MQPRCAEEARLIDGWRDYLVRKVMPQQSLRSDEGDRGETIGALTDEVLSRVPSKHASMLIAHKRERLSPAELGVRFDMPADAAAARLSQTRALIRTFAVGHAAWASILEQKYASS